MALRPGGLCRPRAGLIVPRCRTLPKSYMEKIVENIRTYNIHALLVIGGFEVRPLPGTKSGGGDPRAAPSAPPESTCAGRAPRGRGSVAFGFGEFLPPPERHSSV